MEHLWNIQGGNSETCHDRTIVIRGFYSKDFKETYSGKTGGLNLNQFKSHNFTVFNEEIKLWTSPSDHGEHIMKLNILVPHSIVCDDKRFDIGIVWNFHNFLSVNFKSEKTVELVSLNCTENVYESISIQYFPSVFQ